MNRDMFDYTYVLPSEPIGRALVDNAKIVGVMLGSFAGTAIVAGIIAAGLLWMTHRPNFTDGESDARYRAAKVSVISVGLVGAVAIPIRVYGYEVAPTPPPAPQEAYLGIVDALRGRGSTDFHFCLGDEVGSHTPLESRDHVILRDSSRYRCRADVVDVEHTPESGSGHSMVSLRLVEEECDTGFNLTRWESVVREHGRIERTTP